MLKVQANLPEKLALLIEHKTYLELKAEIFEAYKKWKKNVCLDNSCHILSLVLKIISLPHIE